MRDYYVYLHRRKTDGAVFYVGKGCNNRAVSKLRNNLWHRIANKYGYYVEVIVSGLQEWAAYEIEMGLIAYYGRRNIGQGELANLTDGGEGCVGYVVGEETRLKRGRSMKGWHSVAENKQVHQEALKRAFSSEDFKRRKSESAKRSHSSPEVRHKLSVGIKAACARPEVKAKRREANIGGKNPAAKAVQCMETGKIFGSASEAKSWLVSQGRRGCVVSAANGKGNTAGGMHWKYIT